MIRIRVIEGQSLEDIAILQYGSLDGLGQILRDNHQLSWTSTLQSGDEILINQQKVLNADVVKYFQNQSTPLATAEGAYIPNTNPGDFNNDFNQDFS